MGRAARPKPLRLGEKLLQIRLSLDLSQDRMVERLAVSDTLTSASISAYELGQREPPLVVLLEYARLANVYLDALADDDLNLPNRIPASPKSEGIRRKRSGKRLSTESNKRGLKSNQN
jgi:transcriptional regulator with XRE-family HTH domain